MFPLRMEPKKLNSFFTRCNWNSPFSTVHFSLDRNYQSKMRRKKGSHSMETPFPQLQEFINISPIGGFFHERAWKKRHLHERRTNKAHSGFEQLVAQWPRSRDACTHETIRAVTRIHGSNILLGLLGQGGRAFCHSDSAPALMIARARAIYVYIRPGV